MPKSKFQRKIEAEMKQVANNQLPLIHCVQDADDETLIHVLIEGPDDTPYSGGFFYFTFIFPDDYPLSPPAVRHHTTESGRVSFNPILNKDGSVLLNILYPHLELPEYMGDVNQWSPVLSLRVVLLSIQSMLNEEPWYNELAYEDRKGQMSEESRKYNERVEYETVRVAVIGMLEGRDGEGMPKKLRDVMVKRFKVNFKKYAYKLDWIRVPEDWDESDDSEDDDGVDNRWFWQRWWSKQPEKEKPEKVVVDRQDPRQLKERLMKLKAELIK